MPRMAGRRTQSEDQDRHLRQVAAARKRSDAARAELNESIRLAVESGCSLRAVSEAAAMSRQRVHQIIQGQ
jgi:hypothetical protein